MTKRTFYENGYTFERVDKRTARGAYNAGLTVLIAPENFHPFNPWTGPCYINKKDLKEDFRSFDSYINSFEFYNCINAETGYYTAFYLPLKEIDAYTGEEVTNTTENIIKSYDYDFIEKERA